MDEEGKEGKEDEEVKEDEEGKGDEEERRICGGTRRREGGSERGRSTFTATLRETTRTGREARRSDT
jgi:hypothetical protein